MRSQKHRRNDRHLRASRQFVKVLLELADAGPWLRRRDTVIHVLLKGGGGQDALFTLVPLFTHDGAETVVSLLKVFICYGSRVFIVDKRISKIHHTYKIEFYTHVKLDELTSLKAIWRW